jgi:hypothetical protein
VNYWLAQLILAARNSDEKDTGWVQILVFVILSVFYAISSIVKAKRLRRSGYGPLAKAEANKTAPKGKEQIPRKPARKPPESTRDLQILKQFFGLSEEPESSSQPSPEAPEPLVRAKRPAVARQVTMPQVQPKLEKITAGVAASLVTAERAIAGAEIPQANATLRSTLRSTRYLSEILSDYDDPEKLRRAILHYEILGKPISLREPSEHTLEF